MWTALQPAAPCHQGEIPRKSKNGGELENAVLPRAALGPLYAVRTLVNKERTYKEPSHQYGGAKALPTTDVICAAYNYSAELCTTTPLCCPVSRARALAIQVVPRSMLRDARYSCSFLTDMPILARIASSAAASCPSLLPLPLRDFSLTNRVAGSPTMRILKSDEHVTSKSWDSKSRILRLIGSSQTRTVCPGLAAWCPNRMRETRPHRRSHAGQSPASFGRPVP